jgi:8-oxo-dGTP pyrophosphatase MutT (NUDIX family)
MSKRNERSCGVLVKYGPLYLIGVIFDSEGKIHGFGLPKGKQEPGETDKQTALRELWEETNIRLEEKDISEEPFIEYRARSGKYIVIYLAEIESVPQDIKCNAMLPSGRPEFDQFIWTTRQGALSLMKNHMRAVFEPKVYEDTAA